MSPEQAMSTAMERLRGAFALAVLFSGRHDLLMGARRRSSLAVGYGDGEMYIGTDALALAPFTNRISYLEDEDWVVVRADGCTVYQGTTEVKREIRQTGLSGAMMGKGNHRHFMLKEIHEQPAVIGDTLQSYVDLGNPDGCPAGAAVRLERREPYHPDGLWRRLLRLHGREILVRADRTAAGRGRAGLGAALSRAAVARGRRLHRRLAVGRDGRHAGRGTLRQGRETDRPFGGERAGECHRPRIGCRAAHAGGSRNQRLLDQGHDHAADRPAGRGNSGGPGARHAFEEEEARYVAALIELPALINEVINLEAQYRQIADHVLAEARDVLYLGRGTSFPVALEGALKLKEISYIHAEGYAAGEMKHGPIALIDELVPVVVVAPNDPLFDKTASNFEQVRARGGKLVLLSDAAGVKRLGSSAVATLTLPDVNPVVAPILYTIPVQLLAYYTAVAKGTDVDQPRNLAKSVTVE